MPTTEWLNKYESIKDKLVCKTDLDTYFTEKVIGNMSVDVLDIGAVHFPTGTIIACDPLVELEDTLPFMQTLPAGNYAVKICVVPSEKYGDRYACVKVEVSQEKPVRYELGMTGNENFDEELGEDDYFGFGVDAGMGCIADIQTQMCIRDRYYTEHGVPMMKTTQRFYRKYFGLCCEWYLEQKKMNWAADFQFALFPYLCLLYTSDVYKRQVLSRWR